MGHEEKLPVNARRLHKFIYDGPATSEQPPARSERELMEEILARLQAIDERLGQIARSLK
jgi:hypothetical protein